MKKIRLKPTRLLSLFLVVLLALSVPVAAIAEPGQTSAEEPSSEGLVDVGETESSENEPIEAPSEEEAIVGEVVDDGEEDTDFESFATEDFNNSIVTITSALNTSRCFDIPGESSANAVQVALWTLEQRPNQRFRFTKDSDGYYTITNIKSQLALDVSGGVAKNSASVVQYTPTGRANQKWKLISNANGSYTMVSKLNENYCLDLSGGGSANGTKLIVYEKGSNKSNQQFSVNKIAAVIANGSYTIQSESSGRFLDIEGVSYNNNARAISWTGNNGLNQRFIFTYNTQTGYYRILSVNSNKPLDVYSASKNEGAAVVQYDANGAYNQQWYIEKAANGSYYFYAAHSGKVLDLKGASTANSTPIIVWSLNGGANQRWKIAATNLINEGIFNLVSTTGLNMDVYYASEANDANLLVYSRGTALNQKFQMRKVSSYDTYVLESIHSGKLVTADGGSGARVFQYQSQNGTIGSASQQWKVEPAGRASFRFKNVGSGQYLDYGQGVNDTKLQTAALGNFSQQAWSIVGTELLPEGVYSFSSALNPSLVLDIPNKSTAPGTQLSVWTSNGGNNQMFKTVKSSSGYYILSNLNSGLVLDIEGNTINSSTGAGKIIQWETTGRNNQLWDIQYAGGGNFRFVNALQNKIACITVGGNTEGASVGTLKINNSASQAFKPKKLATISYFQMNYTLDQFTEMQWPTVHTNYPSYSKTDLKTNLDPNSKSGTSFLQFVDLRISTGVTGAQINSYIDSTESGRSGTFHGRGQAFVDAAKKYGLNEVYFVTHANLEAAWGTSNFAKGSYYDGKRLIEGKTYPAGTYYNFWGIGAYDSNPNYAIDYAVVRGWNSPEAAIDGAAKWIALNYVYGDYPQPTIYAMRWDYARTNAEGGRGWHQYATSITWPNSIPNMMSQCYAYVGVTPNLYYVIPRFK